MKEPLVVAFDPYSDRLARDIRNSLSSALVRVLTGGSNEHLSSLADKWLTAAPAPAYHAYIKSRLDLYRRAIGKIKAGRLAGPRAQSIHLWNLGLFFEMHELLETIWRNAREPEGSALKGLIQAAGVYVHFQHGRVGAARRLARRAEKHFVSLHSLK